MISRRFFIGAVATVPAVVALAPLPSAAAGIGEKARRPGAGRPRRAGDCDRVFLAHVPRLSAFPSEHLRPASSADYVDAGKVRFVARDFPLNAPALQAAILAHCAGRDRYFAFIDVLFSTFDDWAASRDYTEKLAQIGELGGVSRDRFEACLADKGLENAIFPVDGVGPGRIRREQHADGDRQWREIRGQDELRGARQAY